MHGHGQETIMEAYVLDWLNLLVRWLHLIAGVAWIGASFYFVMLDNSLRPPKKPEDAQRGVFGELWAVHGGGFYNSQKYLTGPKSELAGIEKLTPIHNEIGQGGGSRREITHLGCQGRGVPWAPCMAPGDGHGHIV